MIQGLLKHVLKRRAEGLAERLIPHLPKTGTVLDVGAGTGHTAQALERITLLKVVEVDVEDMHVVGPGPILFDGKWLPFRDDTFNGALVVFVLHYPRDPAQLLREVARVTRGPIVVIQSVYTRALGRAVLCTREFGTGRFAFWASRAVRLINTPRCPLNPRRWFTRAVFRETARQARLEVRAFQSRTWPGLSVSRDLFVLTKEGANDA